MTHPYATIVTEDHKTIYGKIFFYQKFEKNIKVSLFINNIYVASTWGLPDLSNSKDREREAVYKFRFPVRPGVRKLLPRLSMVSIKVEVDGEVILPQYPADSLYEGLADDEGEGLINVLKTRHLNQWGFLVTPFAKDPSKKIETLRQYDVVRSLFRIFGMHIYITGGNLLGIIREGDFIPHDDDLDCSFCFEATSPENAAEQYAAFVSKLFPAALAAGITIFDVYPGQFHLKSERFGAYVDCLAGWIEPNGNWYRFTSFGGNRGTSQLELTTSRLHDVEILIPIDAERELEITYGESWRVPQKIYQHRRKDEAKSKLRRFANTVAEFDKNVANSMSELIRQSNSLRSSLKWNSQ